MPLPPKRLQPRAYHAFRCIGAECQDTCCAGWLVNVDKATYEAYQRCEDPALGPRLRELVTIQSASSGDASYARIALSGTGCPFLEEGLCGIQIKLGDAALSTVCATYPRRTNVVDDVLHRSLDLSCPEAARLLLLDPSPMEFDEEEGLLHDSRLGEHAELTTADQDSRKPYRYFRQLRAFTIELLQYRAYPLWKRLIVLASFCDQLEQLAEAGQNAQVPTAIEWFRSVIHGNLLDGAIDRQSTSPLVQLATVLELIVARITAEYVSPRFLASYQEFKDGIHWGPESSMEEIAGRYTAAFTGSFAPFLKAHGHMLEHYLVNYVHRTLFPVSPQRHRHDGHRNVETARDQCLTMLVYYGTIQTVLIGVAGFYKEAFAPSHAVRVIQSVAKAFEHNLSFPDRALKILAEKGIRNCVAMAILVRN